MLQEERQIMELRQLQRESGAGGTDASRPERVDFLYEAQTTKKEEYLLGKPVEIEIGESDVKKVEHLPGSNFLAGQNNLSSASNEEFNKMSNDPLVQMRMEEQKALARIMNNPLKMKAIRGAVEERKQELEASARGHKSHKEHKHHRKHKSDKHKSHKDKHDKHKSKKRRRASHSGSGSDSDAEDTGARPAAASSHAARARDTEDAHGPAPPAIAGPSRPAGYGLVRYSGGQRVGCADSPAGEAGGAVADFEPCATFAGPRPGAVFRTGPQGVGYYRDGTAAPPAPPSAAPGSLSAAVRAGGGGSAPAGGGHGGRGSSGGSLGGGGHARPRQPVSAEEKAERVRQMMQDADAHNAQRAKKAKVDAPTLEDRHGVAAAAAEASRVAASRAADASGGLVDAEHVPGFVADVAKASYDGEGASIADRINQQSHYSQRGHKAGAETFMRR